MADIVVCEFMDPAAVEGLAGEFDVVDDPGRVDRPDELRAAVASARALIVRNRTQVRGALLEAAAAAGLTTADPPFYEQRAQIERAALSRAEQSMQ